MGGGGGEWSTTKGTKKKKNILILENAGKMQKKYIEVINQIKSPYLSGFDLITFQIDKHGNYAEL